MTTDGDRTSSGFNLKPEPSEAEPEPDLQTHGMSRDPTPKYTAPQVGIHSAEQKLETSNTGIWMKNAECSRRATDTVY